MRTFNSFTLSFGIISLVIVNWGGGCQATETCYTCNNVTDYSGCSTIKTTCRQNEICYTSDSVDGNGITRHTSGCISKQVCTFLSSEFGSSTSTSSPLTGNLIGRRDVVSYSCIKCCSNVGGNHPCNSLPCKSASSHGPTTPASISHTTSKSALSTTTASTSHIAGHTFHGPLCMSCKDVISPHDCGFVTRCGPHEQCYVEQFIRNGHILYDLGCQDNTRCRIDSGGVIGKRQREHSEVRRAAAIDTNGLEDDGRTVTCKSCCNQKVCNNGGRCGTSEFNYLGRRLCFSCRQQRASDSCDTLTLCPLNELCFIHQIHEYDGSTIWASGCEPVSNCDVHGTTLCRSCCSDHLCNDECSLNRTSGIPAHVTSIEVNSTTIQYGDNVQIICHVESVPKYTNLEWLIKTATLPSNIHANTSSNSVTLYINNFQSENEAPYRCVVENALGSDTRDINIHIN
ncbi:uncharacterized protein LOC125662336 isoform X2 [Ostrea edulis]|uniref:uncharacterized protein LOC125662336 isoform X2 n=1 Tax=Ostrea edulis TaxID=37623 RepID=UPI0024AF887D|nr:uncharacterized protein LOC125662336 isoform X2 [Ostrea edulis]